MLRPRPELRANETQLSAPASKRQGFAVQFLPSKLRPRLVVLIAIGLAVCASLSACYQAQQAADLALDDLVDDVTTLIATYAAAAAAASHGQTQLVWKQDIAPAVTAKGVVASPQSAVPPQR
jgi:hypothetical protein